MRIAFLAPIKPPDHPIASGDRLIARNLVKALEMAGHEVVLATRFIAYSKRPEGLAERRRAALAEAERIDIAPPDLVLAYHPYCKAPDWIGPRLAARHGAPYVTVEAARTGADPDAWAAWRTEAQTGLRAADLHVWLKPTDRAMLLDLVGPDAPLAHLPPFIDVGEIDAVEGADAHGPVPRVLVVGQMRPGKKSENHQIAAAALRNLDVPHEARIVSAHRTPDRMYEFARRAREEGFGVIVAGAGGAAHLPGMIASLTTLPVFGVPVESRALSGWDSLLSIVQMPAGVPVGTLAIGRAGAANAALLAAGVLALGDPALAARLEAWRDARSAAVAEHPSEEAEP